jgi:hypothetical protein
MLDIETALSLRCNSVSEELDQELIVFYIHLDDWPFAETRGKFLEDSGNWMSVPFFLFDVISQKYF